MSTLFRSRASPDLLQRQLTKTDKDILTEPLRFSETQVQNVASFGIWFSTSAWSCLLNKDKGGKATEPKSSANYIWRIDDFSHVLNMSKKVSK